MIVILFSTAIIVVLINSLVGFTGHIFSLASGGKKANGSCGKLRASLVPFWSDLLESCPAGVW